MDVPEFAVPPHLVRHETPSSLVGGLIEVEVCGRNFLPFVDFKDLKDKKYIADGRNGVVFSAGVNGKVYAVKQFDLSKNLMGYEREILAYKHLMGAWGDLVPEPKFLSCSVIGNVRFLGMTMGDVPMKKVSLPDLEALQRALLEKFHFRHLDNSHGRNYITVQGKVMMIDFEEWEHLEYLSEDQG